MRNVLTLVHIVSAAISYSAIALLFFATPILKLSEFQVGWLQSAVQIYTAAAVLSGLGSMCMRKGPSESILLAVSTTAQFLLLLLLFVAASAIRV